MPIFYECVLGTKVSASGLHSQHFTTELSLPPYQGRFPTHSQFSTKPEMSGNRCLVTDVLCPYVVRLAGWEIVNERHGLRTAVVKNSADKTNSRLPPALSRNPHLHAALYPPRWPERGRADSLTVCAA